MKQLRVIVGKDGKTQVAVESGVVGADCEELTRRLEQALGTTTSSIPTDAMYQEVRQDVDA